MNFLFVVPRFATVGNYYTYPIGIASVYAYVKRLGFSVSCLNLCNTDKSVEQALREAIEDRNIEVVCTGGVSMRWVQIEDVVTAAKAINPGILTVVGGPITTAEPELALDGMPIDIGVRGEGELTMAELAGALQAGGDLNCVKGIFFRNSEGVLVKTPERGPIDDLDAMPFMEYEELGFAEWSPLIKYAQQTTVFESFGDVRHAEIVGSRSCPFSCTFCDHPLGKKYRQRSLDNIFREIDYLRETFGVNSINFFDELFSVDQKRMYELAERLKKFNIKWMAQFRVNDVTLDLLQALKESGLLYGTFGIESLSDEILKSMKKHTTRAEIENAYSLAREARVYCSGNIILGDPADTRKTVNESISWWKEHKHYNVSLGFILAVPDAPVYRYALEKNIITDRLGHIRSKFPLVNMSRLSNREYYQLVVKVKYWNILRVNVADGFLADSRKLPEQFNGMDIYALALKCPFCGDQRTYRKLCTGVTTPYLVMVCDNCFASFKIPQKKAFPEAYSFFRVLVSSLWELFQVYCIRFSFLRNSRHKVKLLLQRIASTLRKPDSGKEGGR